MQEVGTQVGAVTSSQKLSAAAENDIPGPILGPLP